MRWVVGPPATLAPLADSGIASGTLSLFLVFTIFLNALDQIDRHRHHYTRRAVYDVRESGNARS